MRVMMSGGGTAGHVYPALAVAEEARAAGHRIVFVGTEGGFEARIVAGERLPFRALPARGFDRSRPLTLPIALLVALASTIRAVGLIRREAPDVIAGFGGYVSVPVALAGMLTRRPVVLFEQNSVPGLANRILSRWARAVGVTYESSVRYLAHPERSVVTGNPVRASVLGADRERARTSLGIPVGAPLLLVFGGSRGARHINTAVTAAAPRLLADPRVRVLHVAGKAEEDAVRRGLETALKHADGVSDAEDRYVVVPYIEEMGTALAAADLVVARAGATSIAEICALGRPSVLVPYPYATDDHQTGNAEAVSTAGAGVVVADADLDGDDFVDTVTGLISDESVRDKMAAASRRLGRPRAAAAAVELMAEAAGQSGTKHGDEEDA